MLYLCTQAVVEYLCKINTILKLHTMSLSTTDYDAAGQPSILENMTFGLEFEMLAYTPRKINPQDHLTTALQKPISLPCSRCNKDHCWKLPVQGAKNNHGLVPAYSTWTTHRDPSVSADNDERVHLPRGSVFCNLELVSRVLNFSSPTPDPIGQTYPCTGELLMWDPKIEINAFMNRIREAFSGDGYCVATNYTTGLHIHLGNGKNPPPLVASLGMVGVFACLERHFDQLFPASRICILPFNGFIPGIVRSNSVDKYAQGDKQSEWVGPLSRPFLETNRSSVNKAIKDDPEHNRASIIGDLQGCFPKAWLNLLCACGSVDDLMNSWPNRDSTNKSFNGHAMAVNITNLVGTSSKSTVEVRIAPGSVDFSEIWAWTDFMAKLMLWLSTPEIDHYTFILNIWTNPNSTILDLVEQIGASQSSVEYYRDRLSADWAVRRHDRLISNIDKNNRFKAFIHAVERNRLNDYRIEAVNSRITQKLEGGYYGQISDALFKTLPIELQNHPDNFLNKDTCDYELFADKVIAGATFVNDSPEPSDDAWNAYYCSPRPYWSPSSFNTYASSESEDPSPNTSDSPTPSGTSRYPRTVDGSDPF